MKLSLVVTVKNEEPNAQLLIDDIQAQTRQPDEWLVVDGGSTDSTAQIFARAKNCTVLSHPGNIAQGRNYGVQRASGEIIAMTDAGCKLPSTWLASLASPLDFTNRTSYDYVGGTTRASLLRPFDLVQWSLLDQLNFRATRQRPPLFSGRNIAYRRSLWQRCPFPEWLEHGEDAWLFDRWQRLGFQSCRAKVAVEWHMRPNLQSFWLQHFFYMRGDGKGRMRLLSHAFRWVFYSLLMALLVTGWIVEQPRLWILAAAACGSYWLLNAARLCLLLRQERRWEWALTCLARLPFMLLLLDSAKIAGFLSGLLVARRRGEASTSPANLETPHPEANKDDG